MLNNFKRGTPAFGAFIGIIFVICGALVMWIGFWKTLILAALFILGYFIGGVKDKSSFVKETMDKVVPEKKEQTIDFRKEIEKEQQQPNYSRENDPYTMKKDKDGEV